MKKNYNFILRYLWIIILLSCLILFSITSLALIPGDFGSAGGGPPDGVVDFEDLMIFAMAYGSCSGDLIWNPICDIASSGGSLTPDGCIDFEDLMIFAMHYGEQEQITPGGMAYIWYYWPQLPSSGFYNYDILLTVDVDPGVQSAYYWAHQFHFKNGDGGYMGLQTNGCMQGEWVGKMAIFSIWEALEAEPGPGASCECFTGEGEGWSCRIPYEWIEGHTYRLRIWVLDVDEQENEWWGAWIIDTSTNQETFIGKIKVPASWQWMDDYSAVWVEYYGQVNDCDSIPYAESRFEQPIADNGSFVPQNLTPIIGTACPTNAQITLLENQGVLFETGGLTLY